MDQLLPAWLNSNFTYALIGLTAYSCVCQALRFRRIRQFGCKYGFGTPQRPSFSDMTSQESWEILKLVSDAEFPSLFEKALQFALFRTYGIPTIAKLLQRTGQLTESQNVAKRYADTTVILAEMYANTTTDNRSVEAYARLNYLHGHYRKQGKISNDDMLFTLGLFMNCPVKWINQYEWRQLTPMEVCALATFHKEMGDAMHISYDVLPSSKTGWRDGLHFYEELDAWSEAYEKKHMVPNEDCFETAMATKTLFLSTLPAFCRPLVDQLISAALDDRVREAIMFKPAHPAVQAAFDTFMGVRKYLLRYLALPRFTFPNRLSKDESPEGRRWVEIWGIQPHYAKATFWSRWGPTGLFQLMIGAPRPGDAGMHPEGYLRSTIGPKAFDGKGKAEFESEKQVIAKMRARGCPFPGIK